MTKSILLALAALAVTAEAPHGAPFEEAARAAATRFDFETAAARYRELLAANERQYGANSAEVARTLLEAAQLPNWSGAAETWQRAVDIFQTVAPEDPGLAEALYRAGVEAQVRKDEAAARGFYHRALAAARRSRARGIPARVLHNLGSLAAANDPTLAESYLRQAIELEQELGPSIRLAATLETCAAVLERTGRAAEGAEMKGRAEALRSRINSILPRPVPAEGVYRAGGEVNAPRLESKKEPEYSAEARVARYQGTVVLSVEIGPDGVPRNLRLLRTLGMGLDERAALAVQQWRFQPGTRAERPVTVAATIEVNFRLL